MKSGIWSVLTGSAVVFLAAQQTFAGQPLIVQTDKSQIISVSTEPGTVVVGNPSIANVTVNGKQIFVHGHAFGDTNLLVLDQAGNQIANFDITVAHSADNAIAVFSPRGRYSYSCAPFCEATMQPGDPSDWSNNIVSVNASKAQFATGRQTTEASAPQAPQ